MHEKVYFCYVKDIWSKNFNSTVSELEKISDINFLIKDDEKALFQVKENDLEQAIKILVNNVKEGAWHDLVSKDDVIIIFGLNDIHKISLNVSIDNKIWLKMKELEPSIRKHQTLKDMILDSKYPSYMR